MTFETGTVLHGFRVTRVRYIKELEGTLTEFVHEKTGAPLIWMNNGEENKLFCTTFRTIPEDSTGVFHIIEHSVMCGSESFPVKEPMVEMMKGSMHTFLNAITGSDRTMYPVSSKNRSDFLNLVHMYLDGIFRPAFLTNPCIFLQEGWHIEKHGEEISWKGVVLNEILGEANSPRTVSFQTMNELLYPDTCYRFVSGGRPGDIQTLDYKTFLDNYRRNYHPSNSLFFLDGEVPIEETLMLIDRYVSGYDRQDFSFHIPMQTPVSGEKTVCFAARNEQDQENGAMYLMGGILCDSHDDQRYLAFELLSDYLTDTNDSPLTAAILKAGLGNNVFMSVRPVMVAQPGFCVTVTGIDPKRTEEIHETILSAIRKVLDEGVDKAYMHALCNLLAYSEKDIHEPQGLERAMSISSWLNYGGDPMEYLVNDDMLTVVREMIDSGEMENVLRDIFLETPLCRVTLLPSLTLHDEMLKEDQKKLQALWDGMSEEEKASVQTAQEELDAWHTAKDRPEDLAAIPSLTLDEIEPEPYIPPTSVVLKEGATWLLHPIPTHGIVHARLYFDLSELSLEELMRFQSAVRFMQDLPTDRYTPQMLQRQIHEHIGSISMRVSGEGNIEDTDRCRPVLQVSFSALAEEFAAAQEVVMHILLDTLYDEDDRILELVVPMESGSRNILTSGGSTLGMLITESHYSASCTLSESLVGITCHRYLQSWLLDAAAENARLRDTVRKVRSLCLTRSHLTVSLTGDEDLISGADLSPVLSRLPEGAEDPVFASFESMFPLRSSLEIPSQISHAVISSRLSVPFHASLQVFSKILNLEYLWNTIRTHGGAYGTGLSITRSGLISVHSSRDPSPFRSLQAFREMGKYVRKTVTESYDLTRYIISSLAEDVISPAVRGFRGDMMYFTGTTREDIIRLHQEVLSTDRNTLLSYCDPFDQAVSEGSVFVAGNADALRLCSQENLTPIRTTI